MAQLTRSGVAYDFNISPHKACIHYSETDSIIFTFSSNLYKEKFLEKVAENRNTINQSLSKRFGFTIENNKLCDLKLYTVIEKRGFLIEDNKGKYSCQSSIRLDGPTMISVN